ncbi:MAG: hypothetical protein WD341_06170 [Tistlia sp.]|uniref:hypothetical protein n=1 Tax=Tistlia sp. TaxID=3057121 RepID=UPI0034A42C50
MSGSEDAGAAPATVCWRVHALHMLAEEMRWSSAPGWADLGLYVETLLKIVPDAAGLGGGWAVGHGIEDIAALLPGQGNPAEGWAWSTGVGPRCDRPLDVAVAEIFNRDGAGIRVEAVATEPTVALLAAVCMVWAAVLVEREARERAVAMVGAPTERCRVCGCTLLEACAMPDGGGCWWAEPGLCSACAPEAATADRGGEG